MIKFLKYIIFFLLGVILYYLLMQTIQGQKVIEGFGTGVDLQNLFESNNVFLYLDSTITGIKFDYENDDRVPVAEIPDSPSTFDITNNQTISDTNKLTSDILSIGYIYRPDYYKYANPPDTNTDYIAAVHSSGDETPSNLTDTQNFLPIVVTPPSNMEDILRFNIVKLQSAAGDSICLFDSSETMNLVNDFDAVDQTPLPTGISNDSTTELRAFNTEDPFTYSSANCIIYGVGNGDYPAATDFTTNFIIIKLNWQESSENVKYTPETCDIFINYNLSGSTNDFSLTTQSSDNILLGKPFTNSVDLSGATTQALMQGVISPGESGSITNRQDSVKISSHIDNFRGSTEASEFIDAFGDDITGENYIKRIKYKQQGMRVNDLLSIIDNDNLCDQLLLTVIARGENYTPGDLVYYSGLEQNTANETKISIFNTVMNNYRTEDGPLGPQQPSQIGIKFGFNNALTITDRPINYSKRVGGSYSAPANFNLTNDAADIFGNDLLTNIDLSSFRSDTTPAKYKDITDVGINVEELSAFLLELKEFLNNFRYMITPTAADGSEGKYFFNYIIRYLNSLSQISDVTVTLTSQDGIDSSLLLVMKGLQTSSNGGFAQSRGCLAVQNLPDMCAKHDNPMEGIYYVPKTDMSSHSQSSICNPYDPRTQPNLAHSTGYSSGNCLDQPEICCKSVSCFTFLANDPTACSRQGLLNSPYGRCDNAEGDSPDSAPCDQTGSCCGVAIHNSIEKLFLDIYYYNKYNNQEMNNMLITKQHIRNYIYGELIDFDATSRTVTYTGFLNDSDPPTNPATVSRSDIDNESARSSCAQEVFDTIKDNFNTNIRTLLDGIPTSGTPNDSDLADSLVILIDDLKLKDENSDGEALSLGNLNDIDSDDDYRDKFGELFSDSSSDGHVFGKELGNSLDERAGVSANINTVETQFGNFIGLTGSANEGTPGLGMHILGGSSNLLRDIKLSIILLDSTIPPGTAGVNLLNKTPLELSYPDDVYNKATFAMAL